MSICAGPTPWASCTLILVRSVSAPGRGQPASRLSGGLLDADQGAVNQHLAEAGHHRLLLRRWVAEVVKGRQLNELEQPPGRLEIDVRVVAEHRLRALVPLDDVD